MDKIKRIQLLTKAEVSDLYDLPDFTEQERELFFSISDVEREALNQYHTIRTRVYFILQLGYFKAKQQLFNFYFEDIMDDSRHILQLHYNRTDDKMTGTLSRDSRRHRMVCA